MSHLSAVRGLRAEGGPSKPQTRLVHGRKLDKYAAIEAEMQAAKSAAKDSASILQKLTAKKREQKQRIAGSSQKFDWMKESKTLRRCENDLLNEVTGHFRELERNADKQFGSDCSDLLSLLFDTLETFSGDRSETSLSIRNVKSMARVAMMKRERETLRAFITMYSETVNGHKNELYQLEASGAVLEADLKIELASIFSAANTLTKNPLTADEEEELGAGGKEVYQYLREDEIDMIRSHCLSTVESIDQSYLAQLTALIEAFHTSCLKIKSEYRIKGGEEIEDIDGEGGGENFQRIWGASRAQVEERLVKVLKFHGSTADTRETLMRRLAIEFSAVPQININAFYEEYRVRKKFKKQKEILLQSWERDRAVPLQAARRAFQEKNTENARAAEQATKLVEQQLRCEEIRARLEGLKEEQRKSDEERRKREAELRAIDDEIKTQKNLKQLQVLREKKMRLAKWREEHAQAAAKLREERLRAEEEEALLLKQQAKENLVRVEFRKEGFEKKLIESKMREEQLKEEKMRSAAALQKLAATVQPQVERDAQRVLQQTETMELALNAPKEEASLFKVNGYNMKELMADSKTRLAIALREAGLDRTAAGRTAMSEVRGTLIPRKDTFTSAQLSFL